MSSHLIVRFAALTATVVLATPSHAQWSSDASVNLPLADKTGEQTQDKIVPTADGGAYISWFDNNAGGYDVYLQRINAAGVEQWAHNGILIADRSYSSTTDYDLDIDTAGNALIAFRDDRFGTTRITANRVAPDGTLLWGANGVQLNAVDSASPKIAGTTDGNIVVAWIQSSTTRIQKLDPSGTPLWTEVVLSVGGSSYNASDMDASDNGGVIISLVRGFIGATYWAQKIDTNGAQVWGGGSPLQISSNALQIANFPQIVPDGAGGAVFGWYGSSPLQCYAQRVNAAGTVLWTANGVPASTNGSQIRVSPSVCFDSSTGETYLFYTEQNSTQSMSGVYGQKYDAAGNRMWTDNGKALQAISSNSRIFVNCYAVEPGYAVTCWVDSSGFGQDQLLASMVDSNGDPVWSPGIVTLASALNNKGRVVAARSANGFGIVGWADNRADANNIYLQNISDDGELGPISILGDLNNDGMVNVTDLFQLLAAWGECDNPCPPYCFADLNEDCNVNVSDLFMLLANWG